MLEIVPLPAFQDNYIWTLRDGKSAAVVDPGEARPVKEYLAREGLTLAAILATHHHPDHVGGIAELVAMKKVPVFGPKGEPIPELTHPVGQGDEAEIPSLKAKFSVLDIPGHTRAHVAYYGLESLFCGDTLFACGCGRVFEGTPAQMLASLSKLAALPDETRVYCGHEYTLANIKFARAVDPGNAALAAREERAKAQRAAGRPTLPSTLGEERATNPFLRCAEPVVIDSANKYLGGRIGDPVSVFAAIREWKNRF
ncbi:MAG TPA: hydroxyacylglutathione hydrolase [Burkholderiales bacterium]|jgi:hydroxyacylglutathione hydrolase